VSANSTWNFRGQQLRTLTAAVLAVVGSVYVQAAETNSLVDKIPPLRPPMREVPPSYWEEHRAAIIGGCVAGVILIGGVIWVLTRPRVPRVAPPEVMAREALSKLKDKREDGVLISRVSQILRHYMTVRFGLPLVEYTTTDFCKELNSNAKAGPELAAEIGKFLRLADEHKFAPEASGANGEWVARSLKLIESAEARHAEVTREALAAEAGGTK
jgi:hypothetical protein